MNANEMVTKFRPQLNRIQKASRCIRLITQYGLPLFILITILVNVLPNYGIFTPERYWGKLMLPFITLSDVNVIVMENTTVYRNLSLLIVKLLIFIYFVRMLWLFEKGYLFNKEVVRCIKILGLLAITSAMVDWFFRIIVVRILFEIPDQLSLGAGLGNLFEGLFIFFIAWVMDEGRKIQEEQELTV